MADRETYNACIRDRLQGKHMSGSERKMEFCVSSKLCSGKAETDEEARQVCSLPKSPKEPKVRHRRVTQVAAAPDNTCDLAQFQDIISQFNNVYVGILGSNCSPCRELDRMIKKEDIAHPVVYVPESCEEILNHLGVDVYPTVVKLSKGQIVAKHEGNPQATIEAMRRGE